MNMYFEDNEENRKAFQKALKEWCELRKNSKSYYTFTKKSK